MRLQRVRSLPAAPAAASLVTEAQAAEATKQPMAASGAVLLATPLTMAATPRLESSSARATTQPTAAKGRARPATHDMESTNGASILNGECGYRDTTKRPRFLVVEDDAAVAGALAIWLRPYGDTLIAGTVRAGLQFVEQSTQPWTLFIIDIRMPDGLGLNVLRAARNRHARTSALVLTGSSDRAHINAACELGAFYLVKDEMTLAPGGDFVRFVIEALPLSSRLQYATRQWRMLYGLTMAEADILVRTALGDCRDTIAHHRESTLGTIKTQIESLLRKTKDGSLKDAAIRLLREVQL
jgi:DNA-binding NarL/FixJ family response regulator